MATNHDVIMSWKVARFRKFFCAVRSLKKYRTEPNTRQDQGNDLQFEFLVQEEPQNHPAQRNCIELLRQRETKDV